VKIYRKKQGNQGEERGGKRKKNKKLCKNMGQENGVVPNKGT